VHDMGALYYLDDMCFSQVLHMQFFVVHCTGCMQRTEWSIVVQVVHTGNRGCERCLECDTT
jgi:hypothetical protein